MACLRDVVLCNVPGSWGSLHSPLWPRVSVREGKGLLMHFLEAGIAWVELCKTFHSVQLLCPDPNQCPGYSCPANVPPSWPAVPSAILVLRLAFNSAKTSKHCHVMPRPAPALRSPAQSWSLPRLWLFSDMEQGPLGRALDTHFLLVVSSG